MKSGESPGPASAPHAPGDAIHFAGFTLDISKGLLSRGSAAIELRPKSYALLSYMARNRGRVLSKDELLEAVWNDVTVTEDSLTQCIRDIRLALGTEGQTLIRTLPRRGYLMEDGVAMPAGEGAAAPPAEGRPRLAVLHFRNLGGSTGQDYLSAGITEDIITALARFSSLTVVGHHAISSLSASAEPQAAAGLLGVSYVVDGSVRFAGERVRITARLMAVQSGSTLWADNFDRKLDDIFAIQDEVVTSIAAALDERLVVAGAGVARQKPPGNWSAYDCLLQGRDLCNQHREVEALPFLKEAVARDPASALCHGWYGIAQSLAFALTTGPAHLEGALHAATQALRCDERNDTAHWSKALSLMWSGQLEAAGPYFHRAMELNPANIQVRGDYANWLRYRGESAAALREIDAALTQDPFAPHWFHAVRGAVLFDQHDYAGSLTAFNRLPYTNAHLLMQRLAAFALQGDEAGMSSMRRELLEVLPTASVKSAGKVMPYAAGPALAHLMDALRKGGLPET